MWKNDVHKIELCITQEMISLGELLLLPILVLSFQLVLNWNE